MKAIVTGGCGFIGSHVVDLLIAKGLDVTVVDNLSTGRRENGNPNAHYVLQDVAAISQDLLHQQDYVFHLAALPRIQPSFDAPQEHEIANVMTTIELLTKLKGSPRLKKLVVSSSSAIYGNPTALPTPETCPIAPLSPYALQKYATEQYALLLGLRYGIPVIALRYFNAYGPRSFNPANPQNAYSSVIGIFAQQAKGTGMLTITGDGSQTRDFVHVRDIARANLLAAYSAIKNEAYNVGTGHSYSILEIAQSFEANITFIPPRKGEALTTWADISSIRRDLQWSPKITMKEGLLEAKEPASSKV